jgi:hypothetical protein
MGSRLILSSGFTKRRVLGARVLTPLFKAAASHQEEGERLHRGGYFIRRA